MATYQSVVGWGGGFGEVSQSLEYFLIVICLRTDDVMIQVNR